ncbi:5-hydroxyisourate hydrolase [Labrenzia sp. DG1229]|uniref:5-hydroxyisourate hydrolase n=1 Tax=Labrenzia sp. DG1229 TaxID=681847 RepID=UPI0005606733|nr:5-hydroxyisourate hydrolase [Labrenzia sp. DG1229]
MAVVTSHALNSVDGSHAEGIAVRLTRLGSERLSLFATCTDASGRVSESVEMRDADATSVYQLVFDTTPYWAERIGSRPVSGFIEQIVLRFQMPDPAGTYHMPVILSPHGYSVWLSG